jgi:hypothetical protein
VIASVSRWIRTSLGLGPNGSPSGTHSSRPGSSASPARIFSRAPPLTRSHSRTPAPGFRYGRQLFRDHG